ncbi:hypothetical protein THAOC_09428 [Thalassiosira oceanica]|uniref:Uncharacterized protein n=1 Tax=Thalassiosira oceanica TaxID=159749 RepID=K0T7M1_THAOC|nr:hypothetical protein THAOC_09428 [Thalassiosira oceanica]|eukprot:EJK69326.1 hypothetical protein THAOC_09428 [Thalassiosira oceanica]
MLSYAFFVKVDVDDVDEEWVAHEYLRRCKVGARESEQDEELWNRSSAGIWNEHIIEAELVGAPVPVDLTMEEIADPDTQVVKLNLPVCV